MRALGRLHPVMPPVVPREVAIRGDRDHDRRGDRDYGRRNYRSDGNRCFRGAGGRRWISGADGECELGVRDVYQDVAAFNEVYEHRVGV